MPENKNRIVNTNWLPRGWKEFIEHSIHQSWTQRQLQKQKVNFQKPIILHRSRIFTFVLVLAYLICSLNRMSDNPI